MKKRIVVLIFVVLFSTNLYCDEVRYKEKVQLYLVNGQVERSEPHCYVTLDIQKDRVIYGKIEDWKNNTTEYSGGEFTIVSVGSGMMTYPEATIIHKVKDLVKETHMTTQKIIRAVYVGGESMSMLLIGEDFFIEVKNSVFFVNAVNYIYFEKVIGE